MYTSNYGQKSITGCGSRLQMPVLDKKCTPEIIGTVLGPQKASRIVQAVSGVRFWSKTGICNPLWQLRWPMLPMRVQPIQFCVPRMVGGYFRNRGEQTPVPLRPCAPAWPAASRQCHVPRADSSSSAERCPPRRGTCFRSGKRGPCRCAWSCCGDTVPPKSAFGGSPAVRCVP